MEFAIPAVDCESGFLWRHRAKHCYGGTAEGPHPPFELWSARESRLSDKSIAPASLKIAANDPALAVKVAEALGNEFLIG